jgi:2-octaprenylphenol hydroxylase
MEHNTEVLVVGAGLVGTASAIALSRLGLQVTLIDSKPEPVLETEGWDQRIYAISLGNKQWLESLGVWAHMAPSRICSVDRMRVWGDGGALLEFDAYEANLPSLSFIIESRQLQNALLQRLGELDIPVMASVQVDELQFQKGQASLKLLDGTLIHAPLLVAADGANSWVRQQAGLSTVAHSYGDKGVVANFECGLAHEQIARQWFREDGVLAWLPLPGKRISIVWSTERSEELLSMDDTTFCETVAAAGEQQLGQLRLITRPAAFPLALQSVDHIVRPSLALVGDAAHQVHPLAGQGVNLGFRDVIALTDSLAKRHKNEALGDTLLLRRYERARKADILSMRHTTHGMHELFGRQAPALKMLRNLGLEIANRQNWLKNRLIKHAAI